MTGTDATRSILLLWYSGLGFIDRAFPWWPRSPYAHTAIVVRGILYEERAPAPTFRAGSAATRRAAQAAAYTTVAVTLRQETAIAGFLRDEINQHTGDNYVYAELLSDALTERSGIPIVIRRDGDRSAGAAIISQALILAGQIPPKDTRRMTPGDLATWQAPVTMGAPVR